VPTEPKDDPKEEEEMLVWAGCFWFVEAEFVAPIWRTVMSMSIWA